MISTWHFIYSQSTYHMHVMSLQWFTSKFLQHQVNCSSAEKKQRSNLCRKSDVRCGLTRSAQL